jgi:hypothetical protein
MMQMRMRMRASPTKKGPTRAVNLSPYCPLVVSHSIAMLGESGGKGRTNLLNGAAALEDTPREGTENVRNQDGL